jgi:hypothetical protein
MANWHELRRIYDDASHTYQCASDKYILACQEFPDLYNAVLSAENQVEVAQETFDDASIHCDASEQETTLQCAKDVLQNAMFHMNAVVQDAYHLKVYTQLQYITTRKAYINARYHLS